MLTARLFARQSLDGAAVRLAAINRLCRLLDQEQEYASRSVDLPLRQPALGTGEGAAGVPAVPEGAATG